MKSNINKTHSNSGSEKGRVYTSLPIFVKSVLLFVVSMSNTEHDNNYSKTTKAAD
jgi:hypothetical protein